MADELDEPPPNRPPGVLATQRGAAVSLRPITKDNVRAICDLRVTAGQRRLVGPAAYTVAQGAYEPHGMVLAIYAGEAPVGVLYVDTEANTPYLVRCMIDAAAQGRGFGTDAVEELCALLQREGREHLEVTFVPVDGGARGFWESLDFSDTGRMHDGEPVYTRQL